MKGVDQMLAVKQVEQDIFGDSLEGVVWCIPNPSQYDGEDKVSERNLEMYLEQVLGAKQKTVLTYEKGVFWETEAWEFPEWGYTVEADHVEDFLEWAYGATKEYL